MDAHARHQCRLDRILLVLTAAVSPLEPLMAAAPAEPTSEVGVLQQITVTARKEPERLQSVPVSLSVLSSNELANAGVTDFADVMSHVPNVAMSGGIAGVLQGQVGIRGISTLIRNIGTESGVGIYVDGVYMGRSDNYNQELMDISQVEVLRGPQGTLFGKNTIAGVFNITTLEPQGVPSATIKADAGDFSLARVQAYAMGPLVDGTLSGKIVGGYLSRAGVYTHITPGGQNGDAQDLASYRASLYYTPTSSSKLVFAFDGLKDRGSPAFFQVDQAHLQTPDYLHRDNYGLSLTATVDAGGPTFTSISAYRIFALGKDFSIVLGSPPGLGPSTEPPLTTRGDVDRKSYAAFANLDYLIGSRTTVSLGLRYSKEDSSANFAQGDPTGAEELTATFHINDMTNVITGESPPEEHLDAYVRALYGKSQSIPAELFAAARRCHGRLLKVFSEHWLGGAEGYPQRRIIAQWSRPIAILQGDRDPFFDPALLDRLSWRNLWRGATQYVHGTGHAPFFERPASYAALLSAFLREIAGARGPGERTLPDGSGMFP